MQPGQSHSYRWSALPNCLFIALILSCLAPSCLKAQNTVQIIQADNIVGGTVNGLRVQKILGNVHLKTKKMDMYADSAYKFTNKNIVKAFGNIEIDTQKQSIWADTLIYFTNTDFCKLRGRVIIKSDSTTLFGSEVNYKFGTEVGHFLNDVRLKDPNGILLANKGYFYRKADSAVFRGDVQIKDSLKYLEGDSLFSNRRSGYYELYGRIYGNDPANNSMLSGDYLQSDSSGKRIIKGHAWLINYKDKSTQQEKDTSNAASDRVPKADSSRFNADSLPPFPSDSIPAPADTIHTANSDSARTSQPDTTHIFARKIVSIAHRTPNDTTTTVKAFSSITNSSPAAESANNHQASDSLHAFESDSIHTARHDTSKMSQPDTTNNFAHKTMPADHQKQKDTTSTINIFPTEKDSLQPADSVGNHQASDSLHTFKSDSIHTARQDTGKTSRPDTTNNFAHKTISIARRTQKGAKPTAKSSKQVRVWSSNFSSVSDSAKYNSKLHTFELWSNAKSWHDNIQLTGPYIWVKLKNGDIKKLVSSPGPFIVQQDTSINRLNQMKGDSLTSFFNNGQLHFIQLTGNTHLLRFTEEADTADGLIEVQAPLTKIFFENGKLIRMKAFGEKKKITGYYLPKTEQTAQTKLDGFAWNPDQRPRKPKQKMQRRLPPIPEKPPFKLPKRYLKYIHSPSAPDSLSAPNRKIERDSSAADSTQNSFPPKKTSSQRPGITGVTPKFTNIASQPIIYQLFRRNHKWNVIFF